MREPGEEDLSTPEQLAAGRDELIGAATLEAAAAAGILSAAVILNPNSAGAAWSTGRLVDGRFVQVALYIGRAMRPAVVVVDPAEGPLPPGAIDLPHYPAQGELLL